MCSKFLSILMTGIIPIGVTERGSFKNIQRRCISRSSKAVHNIKLWLTYSEFTVHVQNQLEAGSFVGTKTGLSHDMQIFYARAVKFVCLIYFFTSTQQSFSYAGRFFLGLTSTKLG